MAISKRLRYEILRRDNHTCRYCGSVAPNVELRVDHVIPRALGGSDEPSNLIASCHDCNSGKTSSAPDQNVVDDANKAAMKWAAAMAQAASEMAEHSDGRTELYAAVQDAFPNFYWNRLPKDMGTTIDQLLNVGLPAQVIVDMAKVAAGKSGVGDRWRYFCGCCWTKVRQMQDRAMELVDDSPKAAEPPKLTTQWSEQLLDHWYVNLAETIKEWGWTNYATVKCSHAEWTTDSFSVDPPCDDPMCMIQMATYFWNFAMDGKADFKRDQAVMDMADAMESV